MNKARDVEYYTLAARFRRGDPLSVRDLERLRRLAIEHDNPRLVANVKRAINDRTP